MSCNGRTIPKYAGVIVDVRASAVDRIFHYAIPASLGQIEIGQRVLVPFGARKIEGYVLEFTDQPAIAVNKIREIVSLLDEKPILSQEQITVAKWMAQHFVGLLSEALQHFLPPGSRYGKQRVGEKSQLVVELVDPRRLSSYLESLGTNATKQRKVVEYLHNHGVTSLQQVIKKTEASYQVINALVDKGILNKRSQAMKRIITLPSVGYDPVSLSVEQSQALEVIAKELAGNRRPVLIHGVTGSGKTEVYLRAIADTLAQGKQAIVLVPEIALTSQTIGRFTTRFGDQRIAVWHSGLSEGERYDQWWRIFSGEVDIVIGARSGIFSPLGKLGLIILDEEHETTFKQEEGGLKYHTRAVALKRAAVSNALVLLGSATPSLESYHQALSKDYALVTMAKRVSDRPLPQISRVDMAAEFKNGNRTMFSKRLGEALQGVLARDEQAIIFLNRRGFAAFLLCRECGHVVECENCQVSLTYHQSDQKLHCHYCNAKEAIPSSCPECGSRYLRKFGSGTQQVEDFIRQDFPTARTIRMDADTTKSKGAHQRLLDQFRRKEASILIGTQMIAKGLDFPEVTLVGVLSADLSLNFPDFRAAERTFQLLTQVAGRAGRGSKAGEVIIQCYDPDHRVLQAVESHNYQAFYRHEISFRRSVGYPPFGHLIRILCAGAKQPVEEYLQQAAKYLKTKLDAKYIFGPSPAPISRIKGRYRYQILIKIDHPIQEILAQLPPNHSGISRGIDIEPLFLL